jgi:PAS domain S-box-containing protein
VSSIFEDTLTLPRQEAVGRSALMDSQEGGRIWHDTGALSLRPRRWSTEIKMLAAGAAVILCLVSASLVTFQAMQDYARSTDGVQRTLDILATLQSLNGDLSSNQMDVMAYVIDEDATPLAEVSQRATRIRTNLAHLKAEVIDAGERTQLDELAAGLEAANALHQRAINIRSTGDAGGALHLLTSSGTTGRLATLGAHIDGMIGRERQLFVDHQALENARRLDVHRLSAGMLLLFLVTTVLLFGHIRHDLRLRARIGRDRDAMRQFLESIITAIPHPILIKDAATLKYLLVNPAMATLLGQPRKNTLDKNDFSFFQPDRAARAQELDRQAVESGTLAIDVVRVPTAQHGERTFRTVRLPFADTTNGKAYLLTIAEDITELLSNQEQLADMNRLLQNQAGELRAANNELSNFSYTVSHDLRTPLRAIDGFAEMLADDYAAAFDERGRRYLSVIRESSQRMGSLIDALLYYTRIGRDAVTLAPVNMDQLVAGAREAAAAAFPTLDIQWDIGPVPEASGDRDLLRQVWTNLLANAVQFSQKQPQPVITVRGRIENREAIYSVADNGIGFDMQFYSKLFGLFQRLHTEAPYTGAGVGLAMVQRIVAHHGGRAWATGSPGAGATFFFSLPQMGRASGPRDRI